LENLLKPYVLLVATTLGLCRIYIAYTIEPETITNVDLFKTIAHLFVGGLFMSWWHTKESWKLWTLLGLSLLELSAFLVTRLTTLFTLQL